MDESLYHRFAEVERTHWWFRARRDIVLATLARYIDPGASVLDVGCGTGFVLDAARTQYACWGIDPSPIALAIARARGIPNVLPGSAEDLSSVSGRHFEAALYLDVLEHLDDDVASLQRAREVLAPGGVVVVTVPAFMFLWSQHDKLNRHRRRYTAGELKPRLEKAGFHVEQLSYFNSHLFPLAVAVRLGRIVLRNDGGEDFRVPPGPVNALFHKVFASERLRLADPRRRPFRLGLSLLAVGRKLSMRSEQEG